jgi:GDP-L-fucose synthase
LGAALVRQLTQQGFTNLVGLPPSEPDLTDASAVEAFFAQTQPEYVFVVAGKSGGIAANQKYPAELMLDNLRVITHVIHAAYQYRAKKLLYLASSCVYPKQCPQPMQIESLMTGPLEPTNEAYATAKLAGIRLTQAYRQQYGVDFIAGIPTNYFGPGDHFDPEDSHVIGALIHKMHQAKLIGAPAVEIWGTGQPRREFLYADDLADASIFVMRHYSQLQPLNLGGGVDVSIGELAVMIKEVVGYTGQLEFNPHRPDGMPLKILDSNPLKALGWQPQGDFKTALIQTYRWFLQTQSQTEADVNVR